MKPWQNRINPVLLPYLGYAAALSLWYALSFPHFIGSDIQDFGLGSVFISIAESTQSAGFYSRDVEGALIREVQREPFYPYALVLMRKLGMGYAGLITLQKIFCLLALALWMRAIHKRYGRHLLGFFFLLLFGSSTIPFYSSLFYAYSFQFFFITLAILFLTRCLESQQIRFGVLAGLCLGLASYERGAFLMLAPFLAISLLGILRNQVVIGWKPIFIFLSVAMLIPAPWLMRNASLGVVGMNQISGYALAYTYGYLTYNPDDSDDVRLQGYLNRFDTDVGSQQFIADGVIRGEGNFQEMDQQVSHLVQNRMLRFKRKTAWQMAKSLLNFPSRLVSHKSLIARGNEMLPGSYYSNFANAKPPSPLDFALLLAALAGMVMGCRRRDPLFLIGSLVTGYVFLFSTLPITFDPRYRGAADLFLYAAAAYFFQQVVSYQAKSVST
jgi:hypothetical protein